MKPVARGAWFSGVCSGREHWETSGEKVGQVQRMITCVWLQWLAGRDRLRGVGERHRERETETWEVSADCHGGIDCRSYVCFEDCAVVALLFLCVFLWLKTPSLRNANLVFFLPHPEAEPYHTGAETREGRREPLPSCRPRRVRRLRMSSIRSRASIRSTIKRCWTWGRIRNVVSRPSSGRSRRTASCSGAGWTGRFGPGEQHRLWPRPPTCRWTRWVRRMIRRRSSTSSRGPPRHVGGLQRTGPCASFPCCRGRPSWRRNSCQFRTSWSTTISKGPSSSGSAWTLNSIGNASVRWSWGKTAGPSWWLNSSGTRAANGCWLGETMSTR